MLKKSLIAIALASVSTVATAGTITVPATPAAYSVEGYALASAADKKITSAVTIKADVGYVANDVVVLTLSNGTFDTDATITVVTADVSFLDYQTPTTVRLRLGNDIAKDGLIELTGVVYTAASAADEDEVKMSSYVISSNATIGTYDKGEEVAVAAFEQQYVAGTISKLDGEVSTGKGRQEFTGADNLKDSLSLAVTPNGNTLELAITDAATTTEVTYVLSGSDLSFAADYDLKANGGNEDGKLSDAELKKAFTLTKPSKGTLSINEGYTELTIKEATTDATDGLALDVNVIGNDKDGSELAAPQNFNVKATIKSAEGEFTVKGLDEASAGAWSLDGSSGDIKFLPFAPVYAQSVTVTNSGTVVGEISVDIFFNGEKFSKTLDAEAAANSVTDISSEVRKFAEDSGVDGNARVRVTVNAPNCNVDAIYYHKADADRVKTF